MKKRILFILAVMIIGVGQTQAGLIDPCKHPLLWKIFHPLKQPPSCPSPGPGPSPGPSPGPPVPPIPPTPPLPPPTPVAGLRVLIVHDVTKDTPALINELASTNLHVYLAKKCVEYRILDQATNMANDNQIFQDAMKRPHASLPWIWMGLNDKFVEQALPATVNDTVGLIERGFPPPPPPMPPAPAPPIPPKAGANGYQWRAAHDGGQQIALYENGRQVGIYDYADGSYWPLSGGRWGERQNLPVQLPVYDPLRHLTPNPGDHMHQCAMGHVWWHGAAANGSVIGHQCPVCGMQDLVIRDYAPMQNQQAAQPFQLYNNRGGCPGGNCPSSGGQGRAILPWRR